MLQSIGRLDHTTLSRRVHSFDRDVDLMIGSIFAYPANDQACAPILVITFLLLCFTCCVCTLIRKMDHANDFDNYSDLLLTSHALDVIAGQSLQWDTIVIGSGMGGLSAAAALAKGGKERVLILEKHTKLGGTTHVFREKGVDFDTGLHYVGGRVWHPTSVVRKVFDWTTDGKVQWERLDDVYDVAVVNGEKFDSRSGVAKQQFDLNQRFPEFKEQLSAYWKEIEKEGDRFALYIQRQLASAYVPSFFIPKDATFGQETVDQALDRIGITEKTLRDVLTYLHGDYGVMPDEGSWTMHCAAYPVGGSGKIARDVLAVVESYGGRAATRAQVEQIVVEKGAAVGVMVKGRMIRAKKVLSAVGAYHTFVTLLPKEIGVKHPFLEKAREELTGETTGLKSSPSHAMTFLALKGSAKELSIPKANWWVNDDPRFPSVFISFPSAKDPSWSSRHPDVSVCEIVVEAPHEMFVQWKSDPVKNRSPEYAKLKERLADDMCDILFKHFPQLKDKVEFRDVSTPLSAEHFLGSKKGCAYGLACTPERYSCEYLKPLTPIKNLYLGAQDIVSCSIAGSAMGGIIAACAANFKVLWDWAQIFYTDRPATEAPDQWRTEDEVDAGGVIF